MKHEKISWHGFPSFLVEVTFVVRVSMLEIFLAAKEVHHRTYLVLKMPWLNGIIRVNRSFELSHIYDKEFHKMMQKIDMITGYTEPKEKDRTQQIFQLRSISAKRYTKCKENSSPYRGPEQRYSKRV
jgi:hypothetical protein